MRRSVGEREMSEEAQPALDDLHTLGALLERHIRYEERALGPLIESSSTKSD